MTVIEEVAAERQRQISKEGWTLEHDDEHTDGSLADAAACYAATTRAFKAEGISGSRLHVLFGPLWPKSWADRWYRPQRSRRRKLIIAAALIVAEIERLDRAEPLSAHQRPEGER